MAVFNALPVSFDHVFFFIQYFCWECELNVMNDIEEVVYSSGSLFPLYLRLFSFDFIFTYLQMDAHYLSFEV